jgi:transposase
MTGWGDKAVYLCCGHTDMRKSINGLMTLVQQSFSLDQILEWDGDGFWLYFKRLERGHFRWPTEGNTPTMTLDGEELSCLIDGARLEKKLGRKEVFKLKNICP